MATAKELNKAQKLQKHRAETAAKRAEQDRIAREQADADARVKAERPESVDDLPPLPKGRDMTANEIRIRQRTIHNHQRDLNRAAANAAGKAVQDVLQGRKNARDVHSRLQRRDTAADNLARKAMEKASADLQGKDK